MAKFTLGGKATNTNADLPAVGSTAPDFRLVNSKMQDVSLSDYAGKWKVLNVATSLDTSTCATSANVFQQRISEYPNAVVLTITADLPFAQQRFCDSAETDNIHTLSMMRSNDFARDYGILITDGPFEGLTARSVFVLDPENKIVHNELVAELSEEPDYKSALTAIKTD
jgi:thiol peroxidase